MSYGYWSSMYVYVIVICRHSSCLHYTNWFFCPHDAITDHPPKLTAVTAPETICHTRNMVSAHQNLMVYVT